MNIGEIARLAGVSKTTVSYALSGKGRVSEKTRKRIREIAEQFGYEPNSAARALSLGSPQLVGIVPRLPDLLNVEFRESAVIRGLDMGMSTEGLEFVLLKEEVRGGVPKMLAQRGVCGVALLRKPSDALREWLSNNAVPCVAANIGKLDGIDSIYPDDAGGVRRAVKYLAKLGHKHIAYVNSPRPKAEDHIWSLEERQRSFLKTVAELGLRASPGSDTRCDVGQRLRTLFAENRPTALLCYTDDVAAIAVHHLLELGFSVPEDVSVVGIEDAYAASIVSPPLSSVHVPFEEIGERAAALLLQRMDDTSRPIEHIAVDEEVVVRKSACPPSIASPSSKRKRQRVNGSEESTQTRNCAFGVDLGGTNIKLGLVDSSFRIRWQESLPTRRDAGPEGILNEIAETLGNAWRENEIPDETLVGAGMGLAGLVDSDQGTVQMIVHLPGWEDFPVAKYLREKLGMFCEIDHDLRAIARGEMLCGAARGLRNFCLATVGTGIGICIVIDGKVYARSTGDMGHMTIDINGPKCKCGNIGCLEEYISGPTFDEKIAAACAQGKLDHMVSREELAGIAYAGEPWAKAIFEHAGRCLGFGMLNTVAILNPEKLIIGGGLTRSGDLLLEPAIQVLEKHAFMFTNPRQRIALCQLGDDAGIIGAAALLLKPES